MRNSCLIVTCAIKPDNFARTSIAANFDHGCYIVSGVESAADIEERAAIRAEGGQRAFFRHHFGTDPDYAYLPLAPESAVQDAGGAIMVTAIVDDGGAALEVDHVKVWGSSDDSFFYASEDLEDQGGGVWAKLVLLPMAPNLVIFVDVQYRTKTLIFPERFSLSSSSSRASPV